MTCAECCATAYDIEKFQDRGDERPLGANAAGRSMVSSGVLSPDAQIKTALG